MRTVLCLLLLGAAAPACSQDKEAPATEETPAPAVAPAEEAPDPAAKPAEEAEPAAEELPAPEDFEAEANEEITDENLEKELESMEKELGTE